jgi:hypothetical protein
MQEVHYREIKDCADVGFSTYYIPNEADLPGEINT